MPRRAPALDPFRFPTMNENPSELHVTVVLGTRPEAIKLVPVIQALRADSAFRTRLLHTGQHRELVDQVLSAFAIEADETLDVMRPGQSLNSMVARLMPQLDVSFERTKPDLVLVQGDTTSAFSAALAAFQRSITVAHVEAGLRSGNRFHPFPEETNRRMIATLADLHFAPTEANARQLQNEGVPAAAVLVTGNTVVDALLAALDVSPQAPVLSDLAEETGEIALITLHRRESWIGSAKPLRRILEGVRRSAVDHPSARYVLPMHHNPKVRRLAEEVLSGTPNVDLIDPLPYVSFVHLMKRSKVVLTDSGGIQEEAPSLGVPVVVARETTERSEALETGQARLVGTESSAIREALDALLVASRKEPGDILQSNPYGDGRASSRIRRRILAHFGLEKFPGPFIPEALFEKPPVRATS